MLVVAVFYLFGSCTRDSDRFILYTKYNGKNNIIRKNIFELKEDSIAGFDSITVMYDHRILCKFKQKVVDSLGIFRICNDSLFLMHSFLDSVKCFQTCLSDGPFLNNHIRLIGFRDYLISHKSYRVFHYSEDKGTHSSYDSYYLQGMGFICIYNFDRDEYILSDSADIKSIPLREITTILVKDTSFFAKFTLPKLFPGYYRAKANVYENQ